MKYALAYLNLPTASFKRHYLIIIISVYLWMS